MYNIVFFKKNYVLLASGALMAYAPHAATGSQSNIPNGQSNNTNYNNISEESAHSREEKTIVVTGTNIRGVDIPVGSNLVTIDREKIDQQGYSTVRDLSEDLLMNFGGGASGELQPGTEASKNSSYGTALNLRGLGNMATLSLINGRRLPVTGFDGGVPDISSIPISIIERVEVLPDGASAVYGSDAVAGVVNFILRERFDGFETRARYGFGTESNVDEYNFSQTGGLSWESGSAIIAYDFTFRDRLQARDRPFTKSNDLRNFGGNDYRLFFGQPGNILDPGTFTVLYAVPGARTGSNLSVDQLLGPEFTNYTDTGKTQSIIPEQKLHSVFLYARQSVLDSVELYLEGRYANRHFESVGINFLNLLTVPSNNPYYIDAYGNGQPLLVAYSFEGDVNPNTATGRVETISATLGITIDHENGWNTNVYTSYAEDDSIARSQSINSSGLDQALSSSDPNKAIDPFGGPNSNNRTIVASLIDRRKLSTKGDTWQSNITSNGPLFDFYGNSVRAAVGLEYRKNTFTRRDPDIPEDKSDLKRKVPAIFGELYVPLTGGITSLPGVEKLELSFSLRHERYSDSSLYPTPVERENQSSTNPRIGILWAPTSWVHLTGSYGTSFRAPSLSALTQVPNLSSGILFDPASPSGQSYVLSITGAEKDLKNETADTWNIGFSLNPTIIQNMRIAINYFNIDFRNQVGAPPDPSTVFSDPVYGSFIIRNPSIDDIINICRPVPENRRSLSPGDCTAESNVQVIFDARLRNISRTKVDGIDWNVVYDTDSSDYGSFTFDFSGTYLLNYKQGLTQGGELFSRLDLPEFPVDLRARAGAVWRTPVNFTLALDINYTDSYKDNIHNRKIDSWTTVDLTVSYDASKSFGTSDLTFQINVNNIFDNDPPYYENSNLRMAYDPTNSEAIGRFISLSLIKRW